jgi:hypothetical protein
MKIALCLMAMACSACAKQALTQIVVVVDSDWDGFDHLQIKVGGFERPATVTAKLKDKPLPRRFVLVHDGGPLGPLDVTVSAFVAGSSDPVLVEPRSHISFADGQTRMLKIDLLFHCIGKCDSGQACIAGEVCTASGAATRLVAWTGDAHALATAYRVDAGDVLKTSVVDGGEVQLPTSKDGSVSDAGGVEASVPSGDARVAGDSGPAPGTDATMPMPDSGPVMPAPAFPYKPVNFDPDASAVAGLGRVAVALDCGESSFDSTNLSFANWCGPQPMAVVVTQADSSEAAVLVMNTLSVASAATLHLIGSRPVIIAVYGDARIDGKVDASGRGETPGPGADHNCAMGSGQSGPVASGQLAAGGGSGGGYGSAGGAGGNGGTGGSFVDGGKVFGSTALTPLQGGCSGGRGGVVGTSAVGAAPAGGGGGAVQISAAGTLTLAGGLSASGGGGGVAASKQYGGGGGGSGGAILVEAHAVAVMQGAVITANGGGGGAGQPEYSSLTGQAGEDGPADAKAASGGTTAGNGGGGGAGASVLGDAVPGADGGTSSFIHDGGGGGGGGVGRVAIGQTDHCLVGAVLSPLPTINCPTCGTCPRMAPTGCATLLHGGKTYLNCSTALAWQSARSSCQSAGLDLAHVNDNSENVWLASQVGAESWIGATTMVNTSRWLWIDDGQEFWSGGSSLSGGSAVSGAFTAWSNGQPSSSVLTGTRCGTLSSDALWRDHSCTSSYAYVCEGP